MNRRRMGFSALILFFLLLLSFSRRLRAEEKQSFSHLDVQRILARPGVKRVAVEFYATWCKPCMEAAPEWKRLPELYRDTQLRIEAEVVK